MAAIVGIDASVLIAPVGSTMFAGGIPVAGELPTWNPTTKKWTYTPTETKVITEYFRGAGLEDLTANGASYSGAYNTQFEVEITTTGTPDKFKWRRDGGAWSAEVNITGSTQSLADNVTLTFGATTGHTLGNSWLIFVRENPWDELPERNEISLSISVDVAEHKPFVASLADAWVDKARTWMNWSGSFSGFYDDTNDVIFSTMTAGKAVWMIMFDSRATGSEVTPSTYWFGKVLLTSVDHTTGSEDFATLDVDFEGLGRLYRTELPV